ncbi:hypothetical protein [uncultured Limosilactobacillus sp.]|uniref:hypothetical protein n=1 Tax=uncultured Limosilactobacillus sp. TaxID=2837629 RepID=UPI0025D912C2|nr:hypothetical protein [uncultured Limosilactobacillus sp.]
MNNYETLKSLKSKGYSPAVVVKNINQLSRQSAKRWSHRSFLKELNSSQRLAIGYFNAHVSDLTQLRIYQLREALSSQNLDSQYWFVAEQIKEDKWIVENPFIMRHFTVVFQGGQIKSYQYKLDDADLEFVTTDNLIEAILLTQV